MKKILITGFQHSGTTMLMQLIKAHPQVGWIEMEEGYVEINEPREWIIKMAKKKVPNMKKFAWGEKLPWGVRENDINANRPIGFTQRWLKLFGKEARVLHILRHPLDSASSGMISNLSMEALRFSLSSLPKYIDFINKDKRCATVIYEDLVTEPEKKLKAIFDFLDLESDEKTIDKVKNTELKFGKINAERAYVHLIDSSHNIEVDYDKIIERVKVVL
jgi:hypothetical protein